MKILSKLLLVTIFMTSLTLFSQENNNSINTQINQTNTIIVYGSDTCHYCIDTKTYLKSNEIDFEYYDIDKNKIKLDEMISKLKKANISLSNLSLPVVDKDGVIFTNTIEFEEFLQKIID